jgi:phosphatidylethanolamine/phosphatidyl-N-methylethanolamine N-methyltransferase
MLRKAQQRVRALGLSNVETLAVMDAKNLAFADSSFDAVVAQYVITAVPDPEATLDDFIRVDWATKHGGVSLAERRPMPPMGHFSLIRYRKS